MEIVTSLALCSSSPATFCPSTHAAACSVSEGEFNPRVLTTHHATCKSAGLSALLASSNMRHSCSCTNDPLDAPFLPNAVVRGSYSDPCSLWDNTENWSDSLSYCSPNSVKIRERSPVSVLHGPLAWNSGQGSSRLSAVMRDQTNDFFLLDQQLGNSVPMFALSSDLQQSLSQKELTSTLVSYLEGGEPCSSPEQAHVGSSAELQSSKEKLSVLGTEALERWTENFILDAQRRHEIFRDPIVLRAFREAEKAHQGQFRLTGDLYLVHCVETGMILAAIGASRVVVAAGLLHDTIDDSVVDYQELKDMFGTDVADLVEGVSRLSEFSKLARDNDTASKMVEADRLHTMFLAMADVRVVLIKLADRLHNMRTLAALPEHKQQRIAKETLKIFIPLANRLGMWRWKAEMEDLCFKHLKPHEHQDLAVKLAGGFRETTIKLSIEKLEKALLEEGVLYHDLCGRCKNLFGIYSKMMRKRRSFEEVHDVRGLRLIVASMEDCYTALETVHKLWTCIPGKLKDYIKHPKPNGYQSLHTVVCGDDGLHLEVQIRTEEMHRQAEFGVAAHWRYKEDNVQHSPFILQMVEWARWMLTWQSETVEAKLQLPPSELDLRSPCPFPQHREGCPHSQLWQTPPQSETDPLFVIVLEDEKMIVQELPGGSTVADLLYKWFMEDSFAATGGVGFCEELRPRINHKVVDDIHQLVRMGDLVELTPLISDESLIEYREKIKRMFIDTTSDERPHTILLSSAQTS